MTEPMMIDQSRLVGAGWQRSSSGRWWHDDVPSVNGRRRLFTVSDALALLDVSEAVESNTQGEAV